ncbi:hypothetical protein E2562_021512 [Oryza meyeriana var. granulata]|uniref:Uncharacterized protein n=1 Tax=Oryza meyeriana var. granulata TaxID=110450 RepID=A0A6G1E039_9ORYZ|nr:hypothetical protein E2562_021512 [Oryza meyeriana var. granulata]
MDAASAPRKKKKAVAAATKRRGGDARGRDLSPAAPPADAGGRNAALVECAAACCVLCACLPVAALCCVARAPLRVARRCCRWRRRRPPRRLAPGGSSSFSDAELGDFWPGRSRRAMTEQEVRPRGRSPSGSRQSPTPAPPQQPPPHDRRR